MQLSSLFWYNNFDLLRYLLKQLGVIVRNISDFNTRVVPLSYTHSPLSYTHSPLSYTHSKMSLLCGIVPPAGRFQHHPERPDQNFGLLPDQQPRRAQNPAGSPSQQKWRHFIYFPGKKNISFTPSIPCLVFPPFLWNVFLFLSLLFSDFLNWNQLFTFSRRKNRLLCQ